jgi:hypothetical protein
MPQVHASKKKRFRGIGGVWILFYLCSYLVLSRHAFREADSFGFEGFYFCLPVSASADNINEVLNAFYKPLILIDQWLGIGRGPAYPPLRSLSVNSRAVIGTCRIEPGRFFSPNGLRS